MPLPTIGSPAPDFALPSTGAAEVKLSALLGKNVLLAFFPLAFTGVCTAEMCAFSEDFARFQTADTVVLPISVDSVPTLKEFKAKEKMAIDLLSDFEREVSRKYGTLLEDKFFSKRAYVLIDKEGTVRWTHEEAELGHKRDNGDLLTQIKALG